MDNTTQFKVTSLRLMRYLYGLGFDKTSIYENGNENWLFKNSEDLKESLEFYFYMRKKLRK